jgi:uncharacterized 2Fe-2S/4Fe-4S cluster protein (DUF4445 family)
LAFKVTFVPDELTVDVTPGTTLRRAAAMAGIELKSTCGGDGTCGLCLVKVVQGTGARFLGGNIAPKRRREGYLPACRTIVESDLTVEVPEFARLAHHRVLVDQIRRGEVLAEEEADAVSRYGLDPLLRRVDLKLEAPTLTENASDWTRLVTAIRRAAGDPGLTVGVTDLSVLRKLPATLRENDWEVTVWLRGWDEALAGAADGSSRSGGSKGMGAEGPRGANGASKAAMSDAPPKALVVDVTPERPNLGLAVDIGTTSVVTYLVDLDRGTTLASRGTFNKQARHGDDVITRIVHATEENRGLDQLHKAVVGSVNELVDGMCLAADVSPEDIRAVVAAGNTTMEHLFLRIPPDFIRLEPYIPAAVDFPIVTAGELGLAVNPAAPVRCVPSVASYVAGDDVAGVLTTGMTDRDEVTLFIDIGTNGEMVLGNREWMVACACSAGPCFEGGGITHGMRAVPGAIERLEIAGDYEVSVETVGGAEPKGICGSGLVDALAKLKEVGIIDRAGKFQPVDSPRYREGPDGPEFVLVGGADVADRESGKGKGGAGGPGEIVITEADVKNLIRAKGAIYAGIRSLLAAVDLTLADIDRIDIAGGFGNYLNIRDAVRIGMLPDVDPSRYRFVGNTSVKGARAALVSRQAFEAAREVAAQMTYLELSVGSGFMEEYVSALFLPHTDLTQFPSVEA